MYDGQQEPIAIVGIGCRLPGAENPQAFWQLLREGRSAIREVPRDRWDADAIACYGLAEKEVSRWGGFLEEIDGFDWKAFHILPRELKYMDPQQRLLLEVAWEALEDAGLPLEAVAGSRTGVFMGVIWQDYLRLQARNWSRLDGYTTTGNPHSFAANRLSYFFDLKGPSLSLDAGCTSSLSSVHLACQSLRSGETELALAGGVNLMISPETMILVSKTGMLSCDGSCRTLDARADGFVRGEGAGIVVLKPLSKVQKSDRVYAVIRGIVCNHNGHNEWMIASSESAQRDLLENAYQQAQVDPAVVDYVELQGTGFLRGDAVEIKALGTVLGSQPERMSPCRVGSVKTNIGHLESAAGIASLIKVALSLHHRGIPPTLQLETLNPAIPFEELHIMAQQEYTPWPLKDGPLFAGVTTLALTGANAHAILQSSPHTAPSAMNQEGHALGRVLPVSARSQAALHAQLGAMRDFLREQLQAGRDDWQNICYTASVRRTHHEFRSAFVAASSEQAARMLDEALLDLQADQSVLPGKRQQKRVVFLFTHHGIHWSEVNTKLLERETVAKDIITTCARIFQRRTQEELFSDLPHETSTTWYQSVQHKVISFAFQCALAALWRSWGIVPDVLAGEGSGEIAAACSAGALSLEEAVEILISGLSAEADMRAQLQGRATAIPCYSASHGLSGEGRVLEVAHWEQQLASPTLDKFAIEHLLSCGDVFLLAGPPSALPGAILARGKQHTSSTCVVESLGVGERPTLLEAVRSLYSMGFSLNWTAMYSGEEQCISLPAYCWQRERFWLDDLDAATVSIPPEKMVRDTPESSVETREISVSKEEQAEDILLRLWREVLGLEYVGLHDSFFELGGHSLLAGQLLVHIRSIFHIHLTLEDLFWSPTPAACATILRERQASQHEIGEQVVLIARPDERYQPFPTTDVQQAYWLGRHAAFELGNVGNHAYIEVEAIDFHVERLEPVINKIIQRHEMLRAVMLPNGMQHILETVPAFAVEVEDLQMLSAIQQQHRLLEIRREMDHELLPLEQWPSFRVRVSLLTAERVRLHLSIESLFIDAWSMHLLIQEFIRLYHDPEMELPTLEISFRDYVLSEQTLQSQSAFLDAQKYWTQRAISLPPAPELPLAQNPATLEHPRFVHYESRLVADVWQMIKRRGAQAGLTPSCILLTAFAEVLAAWSKNKHFSLNLTLFRRLPIHEQIDEVVGDFTSLILLEVDCRNEYSFEERARLVQEQLWRDLDHSDYSGVRVLRDLFRAQGGVARELMPVVFTSLLVQDIAPNQQAPWQETIYCVSQTPQIWLDHQVVEQAGDLVFHWQVIEELFPTGLIPALFDAYCQFLERLAHQEQTWLKPVRGLLPAAQGQVRKQRNATCVPRPQEALLHTLVLRQALQNPDAPAVITPTRRLSYRELCNRASRLARQLRTRGARPNRLIGIVMEKGWEQVVAVLAVLIAGGAYVPIDPALPTERLHLLLTQSEVELVLVQSWLDGSLSWPAPIQRMTVDTMEWEAEEIAAVIPVQSPDDLAYVIYTSGSTGVPKGVMIEHRAAVNTILDLNERFSISAHDRVLSLSALNFDLSVYDIFGLLSAGGAIVLPEGEEDARNPHAWLNLLGEEQVTLWNTVPALLQILVEYVESHPLDLADTHLRLAYLSGDWIPVSLPDRARVLFPKMEIISMGGATEASIWSIIYPVKTVEAAWTSIPYGWPMENQSWEILDQNLEPVPDWVPGNLYIGGIGLARGYWRDETKTANSFITHPQTGERLYRTGDLGRYWPDGTIEFLGREDFQVKIQGYRIELGEIEVALRKHPAIQEAVVLVAGLHQKDKRLLAYIIPQAGNSLSPAMMRLFLKETLPEYMIPTSFFFLEAFPLTANGKVDRKALLDLAQQPVPSQTFEPPSGEPDALSEEQILEGDASLLTVVMDLIKNILNVEYIDPRTNLIEYGASSLDIFRVGNALDNELHIRVEFGQLFRLSTVEAITEYCQNILFETLSASLHASS